MEHVIPMTIRNNFLFFSCAWKYTVPVLIGLLMIIPAINALPDAGNTSIAAGNFSSVLDIQAPQENKVFLNLAEPPHITVIGNARNMESLRSVIVSSREGSTDCGNTSFISCTIPVTKGLNRITVTATDSAGTRVSATRNFSVEYGVPDLPPRITISGKITTPAGHPLEGATVRTEFFRIYDTQTVTVKSEADGSYRINNAHGFRQNMSVEKEGYTSVSKEIISTKNLNTVDFTLDPVTKPVPGFTAILCLGALSGTVLIIISRKGLTQKNA